MAETATYSEAPEDRGFSLAGKDASFPGCKVQGIEGTENAAEQSAALVFPECFGFGGYWCQVLGTMGRPVVG
jgi:hypothetical protein